MIMYGRLLRMNRMLFPAKGARAREEGMTIIEILIVIALIGSLMTILIRNFIEKAEEAKKDLALTAEGMLSQPLAEYRIHNGQIPSTEEGLKALLEKPAAAKNWRGPYVDEDKLRDPWQQDFTYETTDGRQYRIISAGPDGVAGNEDDIIYPKQKDRGKTSE